MAKPGQLFFVVGASGVGKDSIIQYVRSTLNASNAVLFAHRYITRPVDLAGENHIALSEAEFDSRMAQGCFAMHWSSHGLQYGVGIEIDQWLDQGLHVVVNGSRAYLNSALQRYPNLKPIHIQVSHDILLQRLIKRGREDMQNIQARLQRAKLLESLDAPNVAVIHNEGTLEEAGDVFMAVISDHIGTAV